MKEESRAHPLALWLLLLLLLVGCRAEQEAAEPAVVVESEPEVVAVVEEPTSVPPSPTVPAGPTATATLGPDMFVNPVINRDFPDPDVLKVGDTYYAYATNTGDLNIQVARSSDLVEWAPLRDALPSLPGWAAPGFTWAPEVTTSADGDVYLLYFTARYKIGAGGRQCIGVATAEEPDGPFTPVGEEEPLICQLEEGGSIDASSFVDEDGSRYLLWKSDANCCGGRTWIYIQEVSEDGLTLIGEPKQILTQDKPWEGILVEAPTLWKHNGHYYLFYSANDYSSPRYAVGYAVAEDIFGPYEKAPAPLLKTSIPAGVVGPGGQDIVLDEDGDPWLVYHSWAPAGYRHMNIDELVWEGDTPVVLGPEREPQLVPAAEDR